MHENSSPQHHAIQEIKERFLSWKSKYEKALDLLTQRIEEQNKQIQEAKSLQEQNTALLQHIDALQKHPPLTEPTHPPPPSQWERIASYLQHRIEEEKREASALREELWELQTLLAYKQQGTEKDDSLSPEEKEFVQQQLLLLQKECEQAKENGKASEEQLKQALHDNEMLTSHYDQLREEYVTMEWKLEEAVKSRHSAQEQWKEAQTQLTQQEKGWKDRFAKFEAIENEKQLLEHALRDHEREVEEKEGRMKTAQQHLAKKVKENALLNEQLEKKEQFIHDLTHQKQMLETKKQELQEALKQQQEQQTRSQEQFHQMLQTLENQLNRKDEKYFHIFEKYRMLEEKHHQMQSVFSNIGHLMQPSESKITPLLKTEVPKEPQAQEEAGTELFSFHFNQTPHSDNLFDLP